jgi:beta-lactam-binding protein with PASTA domain
MAMICDSCGTENPRGARFCANPECQAFLVWSELDVEAPANAGDSPPSSAAVKPGAFRTDAAGDPSHPDTSPGGPGPVVNAVSLTAAAIYPGRQVDSPGKKAAVEPPLPPAARGPLRYEFIRERSAPVAVQPVEEPANRPDGRSAANGKHGLWFGIDTHSVRVEPGGDVTVGAQILNKGSVVEGVDMRVLGVPQDWVRIEPPRVNLDVGGQAVVSIHFAPPRATSTRSGPSEVEVAVWSSSNPQVRCAEHIRLDVGAYHDLEVEHTQNELTVRRAGEFRLALRNNGNYPLGAGVTPNAGPAAEGKVHLHFDPRSAAIPAGGTAVLTIKARAVKRIVSGLPVTHALQLHVLGAGAAKPVEMNMVQQPLLPRWAPRLLALLVPILAATLGLGVLQSIKNRPQPVPSVLDQPVGLAEANLGKAGFKAVPTNAANAKVAPGVVFVQNPAGGVHRHKGAIVSITVSSGPPTVTLGDLTQMTERQAMAALKRQGLHAQIVTVPSSSIPAGQVTAQSPSAASAVPVGATVKVTVSAGAESVSVPSIKGLTEADAITLLGQVNLRYAKGGTVPDPPLLGEVVSQQPAAGTMVPPGSSVIATIAGPAAAKAPTSAVGGPKP